MNEVVIKLLSFFLGGVACVFGVYCFYLYFQSNRIILETYTNPPIFVKKKGEMPVVAVTPEIENRRYFLEKDDILEIEEGVYEVGTFQSFQNYVREYWKPESMIKPDVLLTKNTFLGREYVASAIARDRETILFYRPKLLILVQGYGEDASFLELEKSPYAILRGIDNSKNNVEETAKSFRAMDIPYCIITYGVTPEASVSEILEKAQYPDQLIINKKKVVTTGPGSPAETRVLRVKRLLYEAILTSVETGFGKVELEPGYLEFEALNGILDSLNPLPVSLTVQLFWEK
jgi:hypothetical protein